MNSAFDEQFDLIVIGGGPGGATVSTLVAQESYRVLLLEGGRLPQYKIGESLIPATVHGVCRQLGIYEELEQAGFVQKSGAVFRWGKDEELWVLRFSDAAVLNAAGATFAYQVERSKFDQILINNARRKGVDVREEHKVTELINKDGRVVGVRYTDDQGRLRTAGAYLVIDASGYNSRFYRTAGERHYSQFFQNVALFCYFENGKRLPPPNEGSILNEAFAEGWMWYIPLRQSHPTLTSVGAVIAQEHAAKLKNGYEAAMQEFINSCPRIKEMLSEANRVTEGVYGEFRVRKDWSYTTSAFWKPGFALVGDAACFIDPVLSTGVHLATSSGMLAAKAINATLLDPAREQRHFQEYTIRYRAEYEVLYNFLVGFYDMHQDEQSYYWQARKIMHSEERANEAFVRLVSGARDPNLYFDQRQGIGDTFQQLASDMGRDIEGESNLMGMKMTQEVLSQIDFRRRGRE